jgi:hypothetical protein
LKQVLPPKHPVPKIEWCDRTTPVRSLWRSFTLNPWWNCVQDHPKKPEFEIEVKDDYDDEDDALEEKVRFREEEIWRHRESEFDDAVFLK